MSTTTPRPTPETDAAQRKCLAAFCVDSDFARKLERERDEALAKLSTVYRWIERNHPDGFIDSQSHLQNLDRVADAWHDKLQAMRDERDEARAIVSACMAAMPVGNIQTHTPENLAARIGDLASALAAETSENEAMREAIKEAHDSLLECREQLDRMTQEGIKERATNTLAKLQPFLP